MMHIYTSWKNIFHDVQQRSILGPFLFNIYLFYVLQDYVDDTTIPTVNKKHE